jgi:hypothetical protein
MIATADPYAARLFGPCFGPRASEVDLGRLFGRAVELLREPDYTPCPRVNRLLRLFRGLVLERFVVPARWDGARVLGIAAVPGGAAVRLGVPGGWAAQVHRDPYAQLLRLVGAASRAVDVHNGRYWDGRGRVDARVDGRSHAYQLELLGCFRDHGGLPVLGRPLVVGPAMEALGRDHPDFRALPGLYYDPGRMPDLD